MSDADALKEYVYRFRGLPDDRFQSVERAILANELYFPHPLQFNDPFDCQPHYTFDASDDDLRAYLTPRIRERGSNWSDARVRREVKNALKAWPERVNSDDGRRALMQHIDSVLRGIGVLSLTARNDNILLWSHYSASHQGICFRFQSSRHAPFFYRALPVEYCRERPVVNPVIESEVDRFKKTILTKAGMWSYEQEYRIIEYEKGPGVHVFPNLLLDGMTLGARISEDDKRRVLKWISQRSNKVEVLEASVHPSELSLQIGPLT